LRSAGRASQLRREGWSSRQRPLSCPRREARNRGATIAQKILDLTLDPDIDQLDPAAGHRRPRCSMVPAIAASSSPVNRLAGISNTVDCVLIEDGASRPAAALARLAVDSHRGSWFLRSPDSPSAPVSKSDGGSMQPTAGHQDPTVEPDGGVRVLGAALRQPEAGERRDSQGGNGQRAPGSSTRCLQRGGTPPGRPASSTTETANTPSGAAETSWPTTLIRGGTCIVGEVPLDRLGRGSGSETGRIGQPVAGRDAGHEARPAERTAQCRETGTHRGDCLIRLDIILPRTGRGCYWTSSCGGRVSGTNCTCSSRKSSAGFPFTDSVWEAAAKITASCSMISGST